MRFSPIPAVLALVLTGCGSDGGSGGPGDASVAPVAVEVVDFAFSPTTVPGTVGSPVTVALHNAGKVPHTFTTTGVDRELAPGERATVTVNVTEVPMTFQCRLHPRMTGTIGTGGPDPAY